MVRRLEHSAYIKGQVEPAMSVSLKKRRLRRDFIAIYIYFIR